jgi:hypothetical protein
MCGSQELDQPSHLDLEYTNLAASNHPDREIDLLRALIRRFQSQWWRLEVFLEYNYHVWDTILDLPRSRWENLQFLKILPEDFDDFVMDGPTSAKVLDVLESGIPSLRTLFLQLDEASHREFERRIGPVGLQELRISVPDFGIQEARLISTYARLTTLVLESSSTRIDNQGITLPSLSSFTYQAHDLSILALFTTPTLKTCNITLLALPKRDDPPPVETPALARFLECCTSSLKSLTLDSKHGPIGECLGADLLRFLSDHQLLTHITFKVWPVFFTEGFLRRIDTPKKMCPRLRDLTVSMTSEDSWFAMERMANLAAFVSHRERLGMAPLDRLTVKRLPGAIEFPYELFKDLVISKLQVMVSL